MLTWLGIMPDVVDTPYGVSIMLTWWGIMLRLCMAYPQHQA